MQAIACRRTGRVAYRSTITSPNQSSHKARDGSARKASIVGDALPLPMGAPSTNPYQVHRNCPPCHAASSPEIDHILLACVARRQRRKSLHIRWTRRRTESLPELSRAIGHSARR